MNTILLLLIGCFYGNPKPIETVDLTVTITNIKSLKGTIEMAIFKDQQSFLQAGKEYKAYSKKVTNNTVVFTITGLEKDHYAISVYQDANSDKECNLNFMGIPKEAYGFSKNFKPKFARPIFDDCEIDVQKSMSIAIDLIN